MTATRGEIETPQPNLPKRFILKERLEGDPTAILNMIGLRDEMGGETPSAKEVLTYDDIEELRSMAQYSPNYWKEN